MSVQEYEVSFQQGVAGYTGTVDTQLSETKPTSQFASAKVLGVDADSDVQLLLRFDNLFGEELGRIPAGAEILSATLTVQSTNAGDGFSLNRMLAAWAPTATWNSAGAGMQADDIEAASTPDLVTGPLAKGSLDLDVTSSVTTWASGAANYGWLFNSLGADYWEMYSAQGATPPKLTIRYAVNTGPANTVPVSQDDAVVVDEDGSVVIAVLGNDTDAEGDSLSVTAVSAPSHGTATINPDNTITYTPATNFHGTDTFSYTASDGRGGSAVSSVSITVSPVNDDPIALSDAVTLSQGSSVAISVLGNDADADGDSLSVIAAGAPAHGTAVVNADNTITYTPAAGYFGDDSFSYSISDGLGGSSTATVNVTVQETNELPVAVVDGASLAEDGFVIIDVLGNDTDADSHALTVSSVGTPSHGTVAINADGTITYTPAADFFGADSFSYSISDGHGGTSTSSVSIIVDAVNDDPVASGDSVTVNEGGSVAIAVLDNDADADGDALAVTGIPTGPSHGSVIINADRTITYTPNAGYLGADSFSYSVDDGQGGSSVATVAIVVNSAEPTWVEGEAIFKQGVGGYTGTVDTQLVEDKPTSQFGSAKVIGVDNDADVQFLLRFDNLFGDTLNRVPAGAQILSATLSLQVTNAGDGASVHRMLTPWSPTATWTSLESGVQTDGLEAMASADLVTGATGKGLLDFDVTSSVEAWAAGAANNGWVFSSLGSDFWEIYSAQGAVPPQLTIRYAVLADGQNTPPIANADNVALDQNTSATVSVLSNDTDANGHVLTVSAVGTPAHGVAALNSNGTITYTPALGFSGTDSFSYTIQDGYGGTAISTVNVTVNPVGPPNTLPVAVGDSAILDEDASAILSVLLNDSDANGDTLAVSSISTGPTHGTAIINPDGTITYTAAANYFGQDSFNYTISDGNGGTATATVTLTVSPLQDAPTAANDSSSVFQGNSTTINVLGNDADADGDTLVVTGVSVGPSHGVVVVNPNSTITYTPSAGFQGQDTFQYAIADGHGNISTATVTVNVTDQVTSASYVATELSSGSSRDMEHDNASKSFYHDGTWWAVLPNGDHWVVNKFTGSTPESGELGGWSTASSNLLDNDMRTDIAWDPEGEFLYVLQFDEEADSHLFRLDYNPTSEYWDIGKSIALSGSGGVLPGGQWGENAELALGLDQAGNPLILAVASSSQGTQGLHVAYATSPDLTSWGSTNVDSGTKGGGGTNGNSKGDFVTFTQNGVDKVGIVYSKDGTNDSWSLAWHDTGTSYAGGWATQVITDDVEIDNHISAISDGETIYAIAKDDENSLWLLKGKPGAWETPLLIVDGDQHEPSRPTIVFDETNRQIYIFYQQSTWNPEGDIYMKVASADNPVFDPQSLGTLIMEGEASSHDMLDPQGPVHAVGADTGGYFMMFAKNEGAREIWYNDIHLGTDHLIA